jgi:hypothetical protein
LWYKGFALQVLQTHSLSVIQLQAINRLTKHE